MRAYLLRKSVPFVAAMVAAGCGASDEHEPAFDALEQEASPPSVARVTSPSTANVPALAAGNRDFAFSLYRELVAESPKQNLFFSPYGISTAMAMVSAGARGKTSDEIKAIFRFKLEGAPLHEAFNAVDLALASRGKGQLGVDGMPFRLTVANALWLQSGAPVVPAYLDTLAASYGSTLYHEDFKNDSEGARRDINAWVKKRTENLVPELLQKSDVTSSTLFVLTNAVYFNASWQNVFAEKETREAPFHRRDGTDVKVPMMHRDGGMVLPVAHGSDYVAVSLPYASDELSLIAVLPDEGAFDRVEKAAGDRWFEALQQNLQDTRVRLGFPKLDYETRSPLKAPLARMGMSIPFGNAADFSGMTSVNIKLDDVIHQARVTVTEGGTVAAAATAVTTLYLPGADLITFDRPFIYAIVDQPTGHILFLGRVIDPTL